MAGVVKPLIVGHIAGLYGVSGWVKIRSHTEPRENILQFDHWLIGDDEQWRVADPVEGRSHGKGIVARIAGYEDRDAAAALIGKAIAVERDQLPELADDDYYWADLEGLLVRTSEGVELGRVDHLFATGANDVMVVRGDRERLIPFVLEEVVKAVHLQEGWLEVEWDPAF